MKTRRTVLTIVALILIVSLNIFGIVTLEQTIEKTLLFGAAFALIYFFRKKKQGK